MSASGATVDARENADVQLFPQRAAASEQLVENWRTSRPNSGAWCRAIILIGVGDAPGDGGVATPRHGRDGAANWSGEVLEMLSEFMPLIRHLNFVVVQVIIEKQNRLELMSSDKTNRFLQNGGDFYKMADVQSYRIKLQYIFKKSNNFSQTSPKS